MPMRAAAGQAAAGVADRDVVDHDPALLERLQAVDALMSVDLPEPDGPHTTTTSPLATSAEQCLRTCMDPYHLLTSLMLIIGWSTNDGGTLLNDAHACDAARRDDEIDERREQVHFHQPPIALRHLRRRAEKIRDDRTYTSEVSWNRMMVCVSSTGIMLRNACGSDVGHGGRIGHAERLRSGHLSARDRLDAGAHDLQK